MTKFSKNLKYHWGPMMKNEFLFHDTISAQIKVKNLCNQWYNYSCIPDIITCKYMLIAVIILLCQIILSIWCIMQIHSVHVVMYFLRNLFLNFIEINILIDSNFIFLPKWRKNHSSSLRQPVCMKTNSKNNNRTGWYHVDVFGHDLLQPFTSS